MPASAWPPLSAAAGGGFAVACLHTPASDLRMKSARAEQSDLRGLQMLRFGLQCLPLPEPASQVLQLPVPYPPEQLGTSQPPSLPPAQPGACPRVPSVPSSICSPSPKPEINNRGIFKVNCIKALRLTPQLYRESKNGFEETTKQQETNH